jgi:biotin-dependent carboxylase-like uncharacterized protein
VIEVLSPGPLTTVQDAGRTGYRALGVPAGGPADWYSHAAANRLVGNPAGAAALECTLAGPKLLFRVAALAAVVGAPATLDGAPFTAGGVPAGGTLAVGRTRGVRAYLAVAGGLDVPPTLGSRSTDTLAGLGPPRLTAGTLLPVGAPAEPGRRPAAERGAPGGLPDRPLRLIPGPHDDWFEPAALRQLAGTGYAVTPASDRVGLRLAGPPLGRSPARTGELPVTGMVAGAIQVPPDGQPILLLANHGPTGGYPVIAVVATADLPVAGQARPGQRLRFAITTREAALRALRDGGSGGAG